MQLSNNSIHIKNIKEIFNRFSLQIMDLQNFHVFSGLSYDQYNKLAELSGPLSITADEVVNVLSSETLSSKDLGKKLIGYLDDHLPRLVLYELMAIFESLLFDLGKVLYTHNPQAMNLEKAVKLKDVLSQPTRESIIEKLIEKHMAKLQYATIVKWFNQMQKAVNFSSIDEKGLFQISELKATRNLFAHNRGIINEIYLRKAGKQARGDLGDDIELDRPYVYSGSTFLLHFADNFSSAIIKRLDNVKAGD